MTTHERAEQMVVKRLGRRAFMNDGVLEIRGANYELMCDMFKLAVRLQAELLEKEKP